MPEDDRQVPGGDPDSPTLRLAKKKPRGFIAGVKLPARRDHDRFALRTQTRLPGRTLILIGKYPPIEGGVSAHDYWLAQAFAELGRKVIVLTNADEVEDTDRMRLTPKDRRRLSGYRVSGAITVVSTQPDRRISFVPDANPYLAKIISLGIELVRKHRPRFLFCSYLEPYGVAGLAISRITGVPYVVQHAGSDIGRLIHVPQLRTVYSEVLRYAAAVITVPSLLPKMLSLGVKSSRLVLPVHCRLPEDVFFPSRFSRRPGAELRLVCYGKVGRAKGTAQLLEAVDQCRAGGMPVKLVTHLGGSGMDAYRKRILDTPLRSAASWRGFVAHWRIAEALRSAHVGVYLENGFAIPIHTPIGPLECWACGRSAILSEELYHKDYINEIAVPGANCYIAGGLPPGVRQLKRAISQAFESETSSPGSCLAPGEELFDADVHRSTKRMLHEIGRRLS